MNHVCAKCGRGDVRLYRIYGNFLRETEIFCNGHIPATGEDLGWWVPLVPSHDGMAWGYTSVPLDDMARWKQLPDGSATGPWWTDGQWDVF